MKRTRGGKHKKKHPIVVIEGILTEEERKVWRDRIVNFMASTIASLFLFIMISMKRYYF